MTRCARCHKWSMFGQPDDICAECADWQERMAKLEPAERPVKTLAQISSAVVHGECVQAERRWRIG